MALSFSPAFQSAVPKSVLASELSGCNATTFSNHATASEYFPVSNRKLAYFVISVVSFGFFSSASLNIARICSLETLGWLLGRFEFGPDADRGAGIDA